MMKVCEWCVCDFKQAPPPKAVQAFCSWRCREAARLGGFNARGEDA